MRPRQDMQETSSLMQRKVLTNPAPGAMHSKHRHSEFSGYSTVAWMTSLLSFQVIFSFFLS